MYLDSYVYVGVDSGINIGMDIYEHKCGQWWSHGMDMDGNRMEQVCLISRNHYRYIPLSFTGVF